MKSMTDRTRVTKDILWALALAGLVAAILRLWFGLGATTALSDAVPWGLWKILNMVGGVALSTSGFTVGFLVYVLRIERFKPFMKPAILIAFLGYGCSCLALLFDIGLPHRFWHPIVMWNINSFLFEVFWCVMLYFTVTAIELAPLFLEKLKAAKAVRFLHRIAVGVVIIGISLSSLHHSSLGSLFLVTPQRLHPLWYTPWLPLLFIVSAMGAGLMVVVLIRILWARWYDPTSVFGLPAARRPSVTAVSNGGSVSPYDRGPEGPQFPAIRSMASIAGSILAVYAGLKLLDLLLYGGWTSLMAGTWESWLFLGELALTALIPAVLMAIPRVRRSPAGVAIAAGSAALGLAMNRLSVGIFGYFHDIGAIYFPSLVEWAVALGVVAAAGLVLFWVGEHFPVFGERPPVSRSTAGLFQLSYGSLRQLWKTALTNSLHRVTYVAVFIIPVAFILMYPPYRADSSPADPIRPARGVDIERTVLEIDGDHGGVMTRFAHAEHQQRLGDSASCVFCHHVCLPGDKSTPCSRCHRRMNQATCIFEHDFHTRAVAEKEELGGIHPENHSCMHCHGESGLESPTTARSCLDCHKEDMYPMQAASQAEDLMHAISFREAMHRTCVACHERSMLVFNRPDLSECRTCHQSLQPRQPQESTMAHRGGEGLGPM
ncbi:hypothetical protein GF420_09820 [candidate division GN15 bacterium]|nr:hypothetical protein [candidate division GN15 bacterium]